MKRRGFFGALGALAATSAAASSMSDQQLLDELKARNLLPVEAQEALEDEEERAAQPYVRPVNKWNGLIAYVMRSHRTREELIFRYEGRASVAMQYSSRYAFKMHEDEILKNRYTYEIGKIDPLLIPKLHLLHLDATTAPFVDDAFLVYHRLKRWVTEETSEFMSRSSEYADPDQFSLDYRQFMSRLDRKG